MLLRLLLAFLFASILGGYADACDVASVLFGKIELEIIPQRNERHKGEHWESALIRNDSFESKDENMGAIRGVITLDRGSFAVRKPDQVVVAIIFPTLEVEALDDDCDKTKKLVIKKMKQGVYVIINGDTPVGTISGRFPANSFGVR
jgi:hypothetical protein